MINIGWVFLVGMVSMIGGTHVGVFMSMPWSLKRVLVILSLLGFLLIFGAHIWMDELTEDDADRHRRMVYKEGLNPDNKAMHLMALLAQHPLLHMR